MIPRIKLYPMAVGAAAVFIFVSARNMIMSDAFTAPSHSHIHIVHQSTPSTITTSTQSSFTTTAYTSTARQSSLVNPDWDNSDFMNSLGGPTEELNEANDKYYKQAENRAAMNDWRYEQMQQQQQQQQGTAPSTQHQQSIQDGGPSPELLKKMGMPDGQVPPPPQQQMQMQQLPPQLQAPQQQFYDANGNPVSMPMVYDANGNLIPFNPQTQSPPQQQQQQQQGTQFNTQQYAPQRNQPPQANPNAPVFQPNLPNALEPPLPPNTKQTGSPDRLQGYNSDAYTMSNTADVYFAQLKQDSKVRKMARLSGDIETSNRVFGDDSVQEIGDSWNSNPYTKEQNLQEARAQIEGIVRNQVGDGGSGSINDNNSYGDGGNNNMGTGQISYKEKLAQMKAAKRSGGGGVAATTTVTQSVTQQQQPKTEPPKVITPPLPSPPFKVEQQPLENVAFYNKPPKVELPKVTAPHPVAKVQQLQQQQTPTPPPLQASTSTFAPPKEQEDIDAEQIAQGGGYGLAAGTTNTYAIPGMDEMSPQEYRDKLQETVSARQAERRKRSLSANDGVIGNRSSSGYLDGLKRQSAVQPAAPAATAVETPPAAPREMPPRSESTPIQAQAATMISTTPMNDPLAGSVACVEAALRMYKESSPDDREAMMIPLREALLAASSASNRYVAESELTAHRAAMDAGPAAFASTLSNDPPTMDFPEKYDITKPEEERIESAKPTMSNGATNEEKLQEVYNALKDARGDEGKLGLKNLSGNEANALIDQIVTMRTVLLDELNNGS